MNSRKQKFNKQPIHTIRSLEVNCLLNQYREIVEEKYNNYYELANFFLFYFFTGIASKVISPKIQEYLSSEKIQKKYKQDFFYDTNSKRYEELKEFENKFACYLMKN